MCLAAPARVLSISGQMAVVDYDGVQTNARLETLGEPVHPGDFVLVHAGFAIQRLSPEDGEETLRLFDELARSVTAHDTPKSEGGLSAQPSQPQSVTGQVPPARQGGHGR
jgi:hydrogenase expression/formation protein HypC